jgi:hypothetical protein
LTKTKIKKMNKSARKVVFDLPDNKSNLYIEIPSAQQIEDDICKDEPKTPPKRKRTQEEEEEFINKTQRAPKKPKILAQKRFTIPKIEQIISSVDLNATLREEDDEDTASNESIDYNEAMCINCGLAHILNRACEICKHEMCEECIELRLQDWKKWNGEPDGAECNQCHLKEALKSATQSLHDNTISNEEYIKYTKMLIELIPEFYK